MVAYSYKKRFVPNIRAGLGIATPGDDVWVYDGGITRAPTPKRHTIRADRKRHARPGDEIQHYCGMRTKGCFLIGRARCVDTQSIHIMFSRHRRPWDKIRIAATDISPARAIYFPVDLDAFARSDGFADFAEMRLFWREEHEGTDFTGVIIKWEPLRNG